VRAPGVRGGWRAAALLHLVGGGAAGGLLWCLAVWDAPAPVGRWTGVLLLLLSVLAGLGAGMLWLIAWAVRRTVRFGEAAFGRAILPVSWRRFGGRAASGLLAGAWAVFAATAAALYLILY